MTTDLGPLGPILVAGFVIVYIAIRWPLASEMGSVSMNFVAMAIVAIGGLVGAVKAPD